MLDKNISVRRAAKMFDVPEMTLRDRVAGKIAIETTKPGPYSMFTREEELTLVEHLEAMAQVGYGCTHVQLKFMAAYLAITLGKRQETPQVRSIFINRFLGRWKEWISSMKPRGLEKQS